MPCPPQRISDLRARDRGLCCMPIGDADGASSPWTRMVACFTRLLRARLGVQSRHKCMTSLGAHHCRVPCYSWAFRHLLSMLTVLSLLPLRLQLCSARAQHSECAFQPGPRQAMLCSSVPRASRWSNRHRFMVHPASRRQRCGGQGRRAGEYRPVICTYRRAYISEILLRTRCA